MINVAAIAAPPVERHLSPLEESFWLFDRLSRFSFVMIAEVAGPLTEPALRAGLDALQARHPLLRARIVMENDSALVFRTGAVPPIPLRSIDGPRLAWLLEAERDQQAPFATDTGPLARCTLIRHGPAAATILLAFPHCGGDGLSGVGAMRDLLQASGAACAGEVPRLDPLALPDPVHNRAARSIGVFGGLLYHHRLLLARHLRFLARGYPRTMPLDSQSSPSEWRTCIVGREVPAARLPALIERARREETTIHGALCAAQLLAVAAEFGTEARTRLAIGSAINVRGMLARPVGDDMGLYITALLTDHCIDGRSELWKLAREVRRQLDGGMARAEHLLNYAASGWGRSLLRRWVPLNDDGARTLGRFAALGTHGATGVSNLGVLDIPDRYGTLTLQSLHFSGAMSALNYFGSTATTFGGRLRWNFTYQEPAVSAARAERVAERAVQELMHSCNGESRK